MTTRYVLVGGLQVSKLFEDPLRDYLDRNLLEGILDNYPISLSLKFQPSQIVTGILDAYINNFNRNGDKFYYYGAINHPDGVAEGIGNISTFDTDPAFYTERVIAIENILKEIHRREVVIIDYRYRDPMAFAYYNVFIQSFPNFEVHNRLESVLTNNSAFSFTDKGQVDTNSPASSSVISSLVPGAAVNIGDTYVLSPVSYTIDPYTEQVVEKEALNKLPSNGILYLDKIRIIDQHTGEYEILERGYLLDTGFTNETGYRHQVLAYFRDTYEHFYWIYDEADDTYPDIHLDGGDYVLQPDTLYPVAYVANKTRDVAGFTGLGELGRDYEDKTRKLLLKLGIDLDDITDALIPDGQEDENYSKIEDAHISFMADLGTNNQEELSYIYEYFKLAYTGLNIASAGFLTKTESHFQWADLQVFIKTGDVTTYNTAPTLDGSHTNIGDYDPDHAGERYLSNGVEIGRIETDVILGAVDDVLLEDLGQSAYPDSQYILRKQISETQFVEVVAVGFARRDTYRQPVRNNNVNDESATVYNDMGTIDNGCCTVPITVTTLSPFNGIVKSKILYAALSFTVRSTDTISVKWWQEATFWELIGWAVTALTLGSSFGAAQLATDSAKNALVAFLQNYIKQMFINRIILEAFKLVVELIGVEAALLLAAIVAAYSGTMDEGEELFKLVDAEELLQLSSSMLTTVNMEVNERILELEEEQELYAKDRKDTLDQLEAIKEQLNIPMLDGRDMYEFTRGKHVPSVTESPSAFYNRTIHIMNPGVLCLDSMDTYIERTLTLPLGSDIA